MESNSMIVNERQTVYFYYFLLQQPSLFARSTSLSLGARRNERVNVSLEIIWLEASVCLSRAANTACVTSAELSSNGTLLSRLMWS